MQTEMIIALVKELKKIAAKEEAEPAGKKEIRRGLITAAGGIGAEHLGGHLLMEGAAKSNNFAEDAALTKKLRDSSTIPVKDMPASLSPNAYFADKDWIPGQEAHIKVHPKLSKSPAILSHEMGHHEISQNRLGRAVQNKRTLALAGLAPVAGLATGGLTGLSDNENVQRLGIAAPALMAAPQLAYEAGASALGMRKMLRAGASRQQMMRAAGTLLPAFGTYAGRAALGVAGAYGAQGAVLRARDHHQSDDVRAMMPGEKKRPGRG